MLVVIAIVFMIVAGDLCVCTRRAVLAAATELPRDEADQHDRNQQESHRFFPLTNFTHYGMFWETVKTAQVRMAIAVPHRTISLASNKPALFPVRSPNPLSSVRSRVHQFDFAAHPSSHSVEALFLSDGGQAGFRTRFSTAGTSFALVIIRRDVRRQFKPSVCEGMMR